MPAHKAGADPGFGAAARPRNPDFDAWRLGQSLKTLYPQAIHFGCFCWQVIDVGLQLTKVETDFLFSRQGRATQALLNGTWLRPYARQTTLWKVNPRLQWMRIMENHNGRLPSKGNDDQFASRWKIVFIRIPFPRFFFRSVFWLWNAPGYSVQFGVWTTTSLTEMTGTLDKYWDQKCDIFFSL